VNAAKRALVTGGSAGLGAAFVALACRLMALMWLSLDRDPPRQQSDVPAAAPVSGGGSIAHIQCDLSDRAQLDAALDDLIAAAPFDLVILNAGIKRDRSVRRD
jgi:NAD(P)-dependent dehydrogenase (short-subunit alcohol dehydrogenase family)